MQNDDDDDTKMQQKKKKERTPKIETQKDAIELKSIWLQ